MFTKCNNSLTHCVNALQRWYDYNLGWNASEYGGVQSIRLPAKFIWTPDILMYNR